MPEIAEVRVVANTLKRQLLNKKIDKVQILYQGIILGNKEKFVEEITGKAIKDITTYGKWLMFDLGKYTLLSHLRMEGKYFYVKTDTEVGKHDHVIFELDNGMDLRYNDVRKFGKMELVKTEDVFASPNISKLGLEPDNTELTPNYLINKLKNKNKPIKTLLLDQSIINGLGNIYANEVLFYSNINPLKEASKLTIKEAEKIIFFSKEIIKKSYELGGCTIKSYTSSLNVKGKYQDELKVHMRENLPCIICGEKIDKMKIDGRSTYYCPNCQKKWVYNT